jgi:hypothetical protein
MGSGWTSRNAMLLVPAARQQNWVYSVWLFTGSDERDCLRRLIVRPCVRCRRVEIRDSLDQLTRSHLVDDITAMRVSQFSQVIEDAAVL